MGLLDNCLIEVDGRGNKRYSQVLLKDSINSMSPSDTRELFDELDALTGRGRLRPLVEELKYLQAEMHRRLTDDMRCNEVHGGL